MADRPRQGTASTIVGIAGVSWVIAHGLGLLGALQDATFVMLGVVTLAATLFSLRHYRPMLRWPWWLICAALVLFLVGGAARQALGTVADLSAERSLVPDLITLPGYVLLATALAGIAHARRRGRPDDRDTTLDGIIAGLSALALAWVYLISPTLVHDRAPGSVRIVLACYPALSVFFVAVTARIALTGERRPSPAYVGLLVAVICMLVGDVTYMLAETEAIRPSVGLLDLPYAVSFVAFAACVLHPSMSTLSQPVGVEEVAPTRGRLAMIAVALSIPALVTLTKRDPDTSDRVVLSVILLVLSAAAVWRVARALRANARSEAALAHRATHDDLTGLPNRVFVGEHLTRALRNAAASDGRMALLFLDVDRFKLVNDTLGHSLGDELLVAVGERLGRTVRPGDLVARIGGDEFVIVLDRVVQAQDALDVGERIRTSFHEPFNVGGLETYVSASLGVAFSDSADSTIDAETLIRDADTAMYQAKESGRDALAVFDTSMLARAAERVTLERCLRHALERRELDLRFQPIVGLQSRGVQAVEALLRWTSPDLGDVPPQRFIPVAEETGLIVEIGEWVLREACAHLATWRVGVPAAEHLQVAVNLSARQLRDRGLLRTISATLAAHDLPPSALRLELTETVLMEDPAAATNLLESLRTTGVGLAIDDFGTGYSSLAYLKRFPVDSVKIDRTFVEALDCDDSSEEGLVAAIIAMAQALGMKTIAEGVETINQEHRLVRLECDAAQGNIYAEPLVAEGVPVALERLGSVGPDRTLRKARRDQRDGVDDASQPSPVEARDRGLEPPTLEHDLVR